MERTNLGAVVAVTLATVATPLACGDDEASPDNGGRSGAGAQATGGHGATAGQPAGGIGGEETTGGGKATSGGTGGTSGTTATGGDATGGASGIAGEGGASDGGMSGVPGGGEGGEGGHDESIERLKRICMKTEALACDDYSTCLYDFRWAFFGAPHCGRVAEQMLICLDTRATLEDFTCAGGKPDVRYVGDLPNTCAAELAAVSGEYCFG